MAFSGKASAGQGAGFGAKTFEKINQSSSGVPGDIKAGLKSAAEAATTDVVKGVAQAPIDVLKGILGGSSSDETGIEDLTSGGAAGPGDNKQQMAGMTARMEESRKKRDDKIRQARAMIASYQEQHEKSKQKKEQDEMQQQQEEQQKKQVEIRQLEEKKQEVVAVQAAKMKGGTGEVGRKKG